MHTKTYLNSLIKAELRKNLELQTRNSDVRINAIQGLYTRPSKVSGFNICFSLAHLVNLANRINYAGHPFNISSKSNRVSSYSTSASYVLLKSYFLFIVFIAYRWLLVHNNKWNEFY